MDQDQSKNQDDKAESLEAAGTVAEDQSPGNVVQSPDTVDNQGVVASPEDAPPPQKKEKRLKIFLAKIRKSINIYLLGFGLLIIIALIVTYLAMKKANNLQRTYGGGASKKSR